MEKENGMQLNPEWLYAAVVLNEDGTRLGTVGKVNGDLVTVYSKGKPHLLSAMKLDQAGLISKNAVHRKYI